MGRVMEEIMSDAIKIAVEALQEKATELVEERTTVRRRLLENAMRDQQIERDINGCAAGARALGHELVSPQALPPNPQRGPGLQQFIAGRNSLVSAYASLKADFDIADDESTAEPAEPDGDRPEMPRIADIIVERLNTAGGDGSKAADIRRYISRKYDADIHEKTVGMTLYRLQKDGVVRREGHTWFLAPEHAEKRNPGVAAPGPAGTQ
jgi:hypothetical protein